MEIYYASYGMQMNGMEKFVRNSVILRLYNNELKIMFNEFLKEVKL